MAKGGFPKGMGGGMPNMNQMMKQAQKMQEQMLKMQEEMEEKKFEATAGGGAVRVVVSGKREVLEIELKPEVVDPDDIEMLQDLVVAAVNSAIEAAEKDAEEEMAKIQAQMRSVPGLF